MKTVVARELQEIENVNDPACGAIEKMRRKTENGVHRSKKNRLVGKSTFLS